MVPSACIFLPRNSPTLLLPAPPAPRCPPMCARVCLLRAPQQESDRSLLPNTAWALLTPAARKANPRGVVDVTGDALSLLDLDAEAATLAAGGVEMKYATGDSGALDSKADTCAKKLGLQRSTASDKVRATVQDNTADTPAPMILLSAWVRCTTCQALRYTHITSKHTDTETKHHLRA